MVHHGTSHLVYSTYALEVVLLVKLQGTSWTVRVEQLMHIMQDFFWKKYGMFYSILNFNTLKNYVREKHRNYLDICLSGRHGCHLVQKLKFVHLFQKFKSHVVNNGRKEGKQEKHRRQGAPKRKKWHQCLRALQHYKRWKIIFMAGKFFFI